MHENITVTDMKCLVPIFEDDKIWEGRTKQILGAKHSLFPTKKDRKLVLPLLNDTTKLLGRFRE